MNLCGLCGVNAAVYRCRRCGLPVCSRCYFHHGLCKRCAQALGRGKG